MTEEIFCYESKILPCDDFTVRYGFEDATGNEYLVLFKNDTRGPNGSQLGSSYELTYFVWDREAGEWSISKIVNSNIFRLTKTVFGEILCSFLKNKAWVKMVRIEGLRKEGEGEFDITKRTRLYSRYLKMNPVEGYDMQISGNKIALTKKIE